MTELDAAGRDGVRIEARVDARALDLALHAPAGAITALVGPNGAGKSSALALVAGTLRPDAGAVAIAGQRVADARRWTPPHRRAVGVLEQRALLFPHLDVLDNVAFGVRARGASTAVSRERARAELDAVGALELAARRVHELSGGQAARVALARALAIDPVALVLDEPFAALDVEAAASLRQVLARRLRAPQAPATLLVTHDPVDVWALADRVVALEGGRVAASGAPMELLSQPSTAFLASLAGVNLLAGVAEDAAVRVGSVLVRGRWEATPARPGQAACALVDPATVALFARPPGGSPRNAWPVLVTGLERRGHGVLVALALGDGPDAPRLAADLTPEGTGALGVQVGQRLVAQVKATQVRLLAR